MINFPALGLRIRGAPLAEALLDGRLNGHDTRLARDELQFLVRCAQAVERPRERRPMTRWEMNAIAPMRMDK